jgi:hypothetical protein
MASVEEGARVMRRFTRLTVVLAAIMTGSGHSAVRHLIDGCGS